MAPLCPIDDAPGVHSRIVAVVRAVCLDAVMEALLGLGVGHVSIEQVQGYGRQKEHLEFYEEVGGWSGRFLPKVRLEFTVPAGRMAEAVKALRAAALTGRTGDGKIFVHAVDMAGEADAPMAAPPSEEQAP